MSANRETVVVEVVVHEPVVTDADLAVTRMGVTQTFFGPCVPNNTRFPCR
jgi:hypothetical protein